MKEILSYGGGMRLLTAECRSEIRNVSFIYVCDRQVTGTQRSVKYVLLKERVVTLLVLRDLECRLKCETVW